MNILMNVHTLQADWCYDSFRPYIRPQHRVALLPLAFDSRKIPSAGDWLARYSPPDGFYFQGFAAAFGAYGIAPDQLVLVNPFSDGPETARRKVEEANILFLPGGLPDRMMERLRDLKLLDPIRRHSGLVIGYSAGALIQLPLYHITPDDDYPVYGEDPGLHRVEGFGREVHYRAAALQKESILRFIDRHKKPVYAVGDRGALIVEDGNITPLGEVEFFPCP